MKRALAVLATASLTIGGLSWEPAQADSPALNTSYSAAARVTPGDGISVQTSTGGAIGGLLDFLTPVLDQVVDPLSTALTTLPSTLVGDLVAGLAAAGYSATSPDSAQSPPASGYPTCTSGTWTPDDCYGPLVPTVSAAPLVTLGTGTVQGYADADGTGSYAAAGTADLLLSLLGVTVGDLGVTSAATKCLSSQVCSSTATLTGLSLLGGQVKARTGSNGLLQVSTDGGGSFVGVSSLSSPVSVAGAGVTATVQSHGAAVRLNISLSLDNLLGALGIADVLDSLNTSVTSSSVTLGLTIGTTTTSASDSAASAGLELGIGLDTNVQLSVLGLATVSLAAPDTTTTGNLVDLQLAYASAAATAPQSDPSGAPPALT